MKVGIHINKNLQYVTKKHAHPQLHTVVDEICSKYGFTACQIFTIIPQQLKIINYDARQLAEVIKRGNLNVWIHSSYLVSPWGSKAYNLSFCIKQLKQSVDIGARGVVFHLPKAPAESLVSRYKELLSLRPAKSHVILENKAMRPDVFATFETPEKINHLIDTFLKANIQMRDIELCIDTAHLYCSGVALKTYSDAQHWLDALKYPECIRLVHINGNRSATSDNHAIAFGKNDLIWAGMKFQDTGACAFRDFCRRYNVDMIMECNFETELRGATALHKLLTQP